MEAFELGLAVCPKWDAEAGRHLEPSVGREPRRQFPFLSHKIFLILLNFVVFPCDRSSAGMGATNRKPTVAWQPWVFLKSLLCSLEDKPHVANTCLAALPAGANDHTAGGGVIEFQIGEYKVHLKRDRK